MPDPYKVAFIGTGGRSVAFAMHYAPRDDIQVVAVADPSADHRRAMREKSNLAEQPAEYDDWRDMFAEHADIDGVMSKNSVEVKHWQDHGLDGIRGPISRAIDPDEMRTERGGDSDGVSFAWLTISRSECDLWDVTPLGGSRS